MTKSTDAPRGEERVSSRLRDLPKNPFRSFITPSFSYQGKLNICFL